MKAIGVIGNVEELFCVKSGAIFDLGVFLKDEAPSGNVTATLTSTGGKFTVTSPLTFTTGNFGTAQKATITAVEDSVIAGYLEDTLTISLANGGYDGVTKEVTIRIGDSGLNGFFIGGYNWKNGIHPAMNLATQRALLENYIYNGGAKPTNATPISVETNYTGAMHTPSDGPLSASSFTGVDSITRVKFTEIDRQSEVWTYNVFHIFNSAKTKDTCIVIHQGHGSEGGTANAIQARLTAGYDVVFCAMPDDDDDAAGQNSTTNGSVVDHKDLLNDGVATNEEPQMFLFDSGVIQALNYLEANFSYTDFAIMGISGGAQAACRIAAYETRFVKVACIRNPKHTMFQRAENTDHFSGESDYEQFGAEPNLYENCGITNYNFGKQCSFPDMLAMSAAGGREVLVCIHANDETVNAGSYAAAMWGPLVESMATRLGGTANVFLDTDGGRTAHSYDSYSLGKIAELFGDS